MKHTHGNPIGTIEITGCLVAKILKRIELEVLVESFDIVPMTPFHFPVVTGCSWTNQLMVDVEIATSQRERMFKGRLTEESELGPVVGLDDLGFVFEVSDRSVEEID